jgi:putative transposase
MDSPHREWPHAPRHQLAEAGTFMVTAATLGHERHFRSTQRLEVLERGLLKLAAEFGWQLEAWAVFSNHYHFVAHSPSDPESLTPMLGRLHRKTAAWINRLDHHPGRHVWHNFWETRLTYEKSYLARLSYVHQNAVRHGVAQVANQYPFCSAAWFEQTATPAQVKTIYLFKAERISVLDGYCPIWDGR